MTRPTLLRSIALPLAGLSLVLTACVAVTPVGSEPSPVVASAFVSPSVTASASPTASPTSTATETAAATATATATAAATATPSVAPTQTAGATPTIEPSGEPSPTAGIGTGFHADDLLLDDDFSDRDTGQWGTGDLTNASIAYVDEALQVDFTAKDSTWSWPTAFDAFHATMRIEGRVTLANAGGAGWVCGGSDGDLVGGYVTEDDQWKLLLIVDSTVDVVDSGPLPDPIIKTSPYRIGVECAGLDTGAIRIRMVVDGTQVATFEAPAGPGQPEAFDRAAAFAAGDEDGFTATFDDAKVYGGDTFDGFPPANAQAIDDLLQHVPAEFRADCGPADDAPDTAVAGVKCERAGTASEAGYAQFASTAEMDAKFDETILPMGLGSGSCNDGPATGGYTIGGDPAGRVACFPDESGPIAIIWTDTELDIMSVGTRTDLDYSALFDWWNDEAGPIRNP
ncbi:MAG: hypothetical protein ABIZ34_01205 [Candidatus Limnocylindrales bacterium]